MSDNKTEYSKNMQKLVSTLQTIIESDEYVIIQEKYGKEHTLEYGMYGHKMTPISFSGLDDQAVSEFLYQGICMVAPDAKVSVMHVSAFGDIRDDVAIDLNAKVHAVITGDNPKNVAFIGNLLKMMQEEETDIIDKSDNPAILIRKIKPLHYHSK